MQGNLLVSFLEGLEAVTPPGYSAGIRKRAAMDLAGCPPYFWATMKEECFEKRIFSSRNEAKTAIFEYIEIYYNRKRRHPSLGYLSPVHYEKQGYGSKNDLS